MATPPAPFAALRAPGRKRKEHEMLRLLKQAPVQCITLGSSSSGSSSGCMPNVTTQVRLDHVAGGGRAFGVARDTQLLVFADALPTLRAARNTFLWPTLQEALGRGVYLWCQRYAAFLLSGCDTELVAGAAGAISERKLLRQIETAAAADALVSTVHRMTALDAAAQIEYNGIHIDTERARTMATELREQHDGALDAVRRLLPPSWSDGERAAFSFGSPKDLKYLLVGSDASKAPDGRPAGSSSPTAAMGDAETRAKHAVVDRFVAECGAPACETLKHVNAALASRLLRAAPAVKTPASDDEDRATTRYVALHVGTDEGEVLCTNVAKGIHADVSNSKKLAAALASWRAAAPCRTCFLIVADDFECVPQLSEACGRRSTAIFIAEAHLAAINRGLKLGGNDATLTDLTDALRLKWKAASKSKRSSDSTTMPASISAADAARVLAAAACLQHARNVGAMRVHTATEWEGLLPDGSPAREAVEAEGAKDAVWADALPDLHTAVRRWRVASTAMSRAGSDASESGIVQYAVSGSNTIHGKVVPWGTSTGRFSARDPNIFGIAKDAALRHSFTSRFGPEGVLIEVDYAQLEVVVLCLLCDDAHMRDDIVNRVDFHCKRVTLMDSSLRYDDVVRRYREGDPAMAALRQQAKTYSFQSQYGAGDELVARTTGLSVAMVRQIAEGEAAVYPGMRAFHNYVTEQLVAAKKEKMTAPLQLPSGLVLRIPMVSLKPPRPSTTQAKNWPVQAFAAELVQLKLGEVGRLFAKSDDFKGRALLVNTVHDCVWIDCNPEVVNEVLRQVREVMEGVPEMVRTMWPEVPCGVPFRVTAERGHDLANMHST